MSLTQFIDVDASAQACEGRADHPRRLGVLAEDLHRYRVALALTRPEVVVECGTRGGHRALWLADNGHCDVVTVDIAARPAPGVVKEAGGRVTWLQGSSCEADIVEQVGRRVSGRRTMVILDSEHTEDHVYDEINLYGPMVSIDCYLVVEHGISRWLADPRFRLSGPLAAVETRLARNPRWTRDRGLEVMHPVSMHPGGWWRRTCPTP